MEHDNFLPDFRHVLICKKIDRLTAVLKRGGCSPHTPSQSSENQSPEGSESRGEWGRNNPETEVVAAVMRAVPEPEGAANVALVVVERAAAQHTAHTIKRV